MDNLKKSIRKCDYIILAIFIFMLATRFFTIGFISKTSEITKAEITEIVKVYEANPIARYFINLSRLGQILSIFVLPAMVMAFYYYVRRKTLIGKFDLDTLRFWVFFAFFFFLINMVNDLALYAGSLL